MGILPFALIIEGLCDLSKGLALSHSGLSRLLDKPKAWLFSWWSMGYMLLLGSESRHCSPYCSPVAAKVSGLPDPFSNLCFLPHIPRGRAMQPTWPRELADRSLGGLRTLCDVWQQGVPGI